jgi:hypothetical protein
MYAASKHMIQFLGWYRSVLNPWDRAASSHKPVEGVLQVCALAAPMLDLLLWMRPWHVEHLLELSLLLPVDMLQDFAVFLLCCIAVYAVYDSMQSMRYFIVALTLKG